ncbi:IclR family transcriptional regulator [Actinomadura sp. NBRC 104412]|uniref:IclR family transcriptional regulator n=1 Tax=Actinomadura sp. NBRC 104412 TaxID=3032203 RepID=UPI0024A072A3|nr:IclR family transcriptional regulator [Actinomadura sp. NBRC 104412]GLZ05170.1 IclR family transcriptional regulator [Actinomadura sp. NBRC 104412]
MKNRPQYAIDSVDHALRLATLLQQEGPMGVSVAAERLGVSRSTAHRLLAMLVYRDFAEQDADRRYRAGPALRPADATPAPVRLLHEIAPAHMRALVERVRETVNLQVLAGSEVRFLDTVECDQILRVGDRSGRVLPAHLSSSGKVLLAALPPDELDRRYPDPAAAGVDLARLRRELALVRRRGFAINEGLTETGLSALGVPVPWPRDGLPAAAISVAMPSARFDRDRIPFWVGSLRRTASAIANDLTDAARAGSA